MAQLLGLLLLSFFITSVLLVPFIDFLYKLKFRRKKQETRDAFNNKTPIFDKFHSWKVGTPVGGGLLIILIVTTLTLWAYGLFSQEIKAWEIFVILFTFISFGLLGLYDDVKKFFNGKEKFFGLRLRHKLIIETTLAFIVGIIFYFILDYNFIYIHWLGPVTIGPLFIFLAAFFIIAFANAFNITDGLDGLATGVLIICLIAFWVLSSALMHSSIAVFIAVWLGALIAFLYFNIYPARIWLGDVGALSFGATLAVIGLLTGKTIALAVIGGVFVIEVFSSLVQLLAKRFWKRKVFKVAPFHLLLQEKGWEEPKIVMRAWLAGLMFAIFGLWLAVIK